MHGKLIANGTKQPLSMFRIACAESHKSEWFDNDVAFLVDVNDKGEFSFYSLPGEGWLSVRTKTFPRLSYIPLKWLDSMHIGSPAATLNHLPGWATRIPENVADWDYGVVEISQARGRVVDQNGGPIPKATIDIDANGMGYVGYGMEYCLTADRDGHFCTWLEHFQRTNEVTFTEDGVTEHNVYHYVLPYTFRVDAGPRAREFGRRAIEVHPEQVSERYDARYRFAVSQGYETPVEKEKGGKRGEEKGRKRGHSTFSLTNLIL